MSKKMTAVEYLVKQFAKYYAIHQLEDEIGKAKQMEKEQIIKAKRCKKYKIPDLLIMHPIGGYHGLIIEVKATIDDVYTKKS